MADFTAQLPSPGDLSPPSASGPSALSAIGEGLSMFATIGKDFFAKQNKEESDAAYAHQSAALTDLFKLPDNPNAPALAGETPTDPAAAAATHSPTVIAHQGEMNRLAQANAQGSLNMNELLVRAAQITQDAINADPQHASIYRKAAQDVLGNQPTAQLLSLAEKDADRTSQAAMAVSQTYVMAAANAGIQYIKDGHLDIPAMEAAGQQILADDANIKRLTNIATLNAASAGSRDQQIDAQIAPVQAALAPGFEKLQEGMVASLEHILSTVSTQPEDVQRAALANGIGILQTQWMSRVEQVIVKQGLSPDAAAKLRTLYNATFLNYSNLTSGPLSNTVAFKNALEVLHSKAGISFAEAAPTVTALSAVNPQAVAPYVASIISRDPAVQQRMSDELKAYNAGVGPPPTTQAPESNSTIGGKVTGALTGSYDLTREQNPDTQASVLRTVVGTYKSVISSPNDMTPQDQRTFGHAAAQIARLGLASNDPGNINTAADVLNTPATVLAFHTFAKNHANADGVPAVAHGIIGINAKNLTSNLPLLASGADVQIWHVGTNAGGLQENQRVPAHISASYNPITGRIVTTVTAKDLLGRDLQLTPEEMQQAIGNTGDFRTKVDSMNRSLETIADLREFSMDRSKEFTKPQLKQLIVDQSGFPTVEGFNRTPMPDFMTKPSGATAPTPSPRGRVKTYDKVPLPPQIDATLHNTAQVAAAHFGVPADKLEVLARAVTMQESSNRGDAGSSTGVHGFMQVTQHTARSIGNLVRGHPFNRDIPAENVQAGVYELARLLKTHNGDIRAALHGYNSTDPNYYSNVESRLPTGSLATLFPTGNQ